MDFINCDFPIQVELIPKEKTTHALILLHGYAENAELMKARFQNMKTDHDLIIYQGFFPLPRKTEGIWHLNYAWYFHDDFEQGYLISPEFPAGLINQHLKQYSYDSYTIIGYSQGGFLAPFIAKDNLKVKKVYGVGCQFLFDKLELNKLTFELTQIHGANDDVINHQSAREEFTKFNSFGNTGDFITLDKIKHSFPNNSVRLIEKLLRSSP